jgi:hypothetical protein
VQSASFEQAPPLLKQKEVGNVCIQVSTFVQGPPGLLQGEKKLFPQDPAPLQVGQGAEQDAELEQVCVQLLLAASTALGAITELMTGKTTIEANPICLMI